MSRTNISVLLATALLGILLVVVYRLADDLEQRQLMGPLEAPDADATSERLAANNDPRSVISDYTSFITALQARGVDGSAALQGTATWLQARGFLGADPLLGIDERSAPLVYYESLDDDTLAGLSKSGDLAAAQVQASRLALENPAAAEVLYAQAAAGGSAYAMLQLSSLWDTWYAIQASGLVASDDRSELLPAGESDARIRAFAYAMAALRDVGPPLFSEALLNRAGNMYRQIPQAQREAACNESERVYIDLSIQRRTRGLPPIRSEPPPVFLTVAEANRALPCAETGIDYSTTLDLTDCRNESVVGPGNSDRELYICRRALPSG